MNRPGRWIVALLKVPILIYRYTFSFFLGRYCRFLPTCSAYALEALERHGPWAGLWLAIARLSRCRPGAACGHDPVPHALAKVPWYRPWRYGKWR